MAIAAEALRGMRRILSHRSAPPSAVKETRTPQRFRSIKEWENSGEAATTTELIPLLPENDAKIIGHIVDHLRGHTRNAPETIEMVVFTGPEHPQVRGVTSRFREQNPEYVAEHNLK